MFKGFTASKECLVFDTLATLLDEFLHILKSFNELLILASGE